MFIGVNSIEIKVEVDSNDVTECPQNDRPSTGMFACSIFSGFICLCTVSVSYTHLTLPTNREV